ncbi:STAS domain-containing protein [Humisphaera borealis]|uniref:STAS domain-containing protein n=1 Tax=Humisphaera borealis TaxID=2807512 RepID=A0A7M2X1B7_9BACT|nr:STAS domain-containing protein [Humisphaera borealis]QOV91536.1 STAS domain-containing protein [Humisphaera borealis]
MATISEVQIEGVTLLKLGGGLTFEGVVPLTRPFESATRSGAVVVNLADVQTVTTPGISLLLSAHQRLGQTGGRLVLCSVPPLLKDVLRRCKLDRVFTFAVDDEAALQILKPKSLDA